jgi:hypothetical protein
MRLLFVGIVASVSALAGLASATCQQSNLTTGSQSSGAVYDLYMPETSCWNGGLVVFAHGYVAPQLPLGVPQDQLSINGVSLPAIFNQLGYAFAASSFSKNGLAIIQGVNDTRDLTQNILGPLLQPKHTYLIGPSEGGLITTLSAEQLPHVYDTAGAGCGPIGSFQAQINYMGDFRVVFDYFFPGLIPGTVINVPQEVITDWETVYVPLITTALQNNPQATAQLIKVLQAQVTSDPATIPETVLGALWYNVFGTADAVATLGGQPYDNHNRFYFGSSNDFLLNQKVQRYTASPAALATVAANYETSGRLKMPIITLHTTGDPVIPYWHETLYTLKTLADGTFSHRLNLPVNAYGHCAFTEGQVFTTFVLMVLADIGQDLSPQVESVLPQAQVEKFRDDLRRSRGALPPR